MEQQAAAVIASGVNGDGRQRVSKAAFVSILVVIAVLLFVFFVTLTIVTVVKIRDNAHPEKVAVIEKDRGLLDVHIPTRRVKSSELPSHITRTFLSNSPIVDHLRGFVSDAEADHIMTLVRGRFKPSTTMAAKGSTTNKDRTSESVFLNAPGDLADPVVAAIRARAAKVSGIPEEYFEPLQVVKYEHGQFYRQHYDYLDEKSDEVLNHGQRTLTILVYLNTLPAAETGGGTKFHVLDYTVKPERGVGVLWHNVTAANEPDTRTLHSGEPLAHPTSKKYAINIWARDRPQVK